MGRIKLKLKKWPFEKGQKVQLIWIGEPFKENNKWMIDTYFCDGKVTKKVIQDWANIHFLSIDKYYTDGDLNSGEIIDDEGIMKTINIDLSNIIPKYNESDWSIKKSTYKSKSRTFSFWKNNVLYTIPIIEIVRAVLAPNSFMLNTILYNDVWEDYFTYKIEDRNLYIYFTSQYKRSYLKNEYYNHLAWVISNDEILKMCNDIGYNMFIKGKLLFDFNISKFSITARVRENKHGFTIMEILKINQKDIKADELKIYHPSFEERVKSNEAKLRTYIYLNNKGDDRVIDGSTDGSKEFDESINNELIVQEYIKIPVVKKEKECSRKLRVIEDNDTKNYIIDDNNSRTLSSEGGDNKCTGIEVSNVDIKNLSDGLKKTLEVIELLKNKKYIKSVESDIVELPLERTFSYLMDGVTKRRCVIAKIIMFDEREFVMLDVERENKALSILIIRLKYFVNWKSICYKLLFGLVKESGKWNNRYIAEIKDNGALVYRIKHIEKDTNLEVNNIYLKLKNK